MTPEPITHPLLVRAGISHGFFTRRGGVSTGLYEGLNVGLGSSDAPLHVQENRRRVARVMGGTPADFATCYQVHSALAHIAEAPWGDERPEGDAVVTEAGGVICAVLTADCAPVLMADADAGVVAALHAGWKGALGGVVESALTAMIALGARPSRTIAVVGPCIAQPSYEVDDAFRDRFTGDDAETDRFFRRADRPQRWMFDLPGYVVRRLERAGVGEAAWTGQDTCADEDGFFSNRRAFLRGEPDFGRMISAIAL